jgi:membrane protein DedA with SNARE-associated domain
MLDALVTLVGRLGSRGYLVIFLGATMERAAFLGVLDPGEALVVFGGVLAASGSLKLGALLGFVCLGAILGGSLGYELGRRLGRPWLMRYGRSVGLREPQLARTEAWFTRHGGQIILLGRFVGSLRALGPFVAGASVMPCRRFLPYNAAGAVLWVTGFVLLGYSLDVGWRRVEHWTHAISVLHWKIAWQHHRATYQLLAHPTSVVSPGECFTA